MNQPQLWVPICSTPPKQILQYEHGCFQTMLGSQLSRVPFLAHGIGSCCSARNRHIARAYRNSRMGNFKLAGLLGDWAVQGSSTCGPFRGLPVFGLFGESKARHFLCGCPKEGHTHLDPQNGRAFAVVPVPKPNQTGSTNLRTTPQMLKCVFLGFPLDRPQKQDGLTKAQTPCQFEQLL